MEEKNRCKFHEDNYTKEESILGNKVLMCGIKRCPYGNLERLKLGGETLGDVCKVKGFLEDKLRVYSLSKNNN